MKTVNSLSGGQTSSFLEYHYPADYSLFAICCIDDHNAGKRIDKKIVQMVNDRLQKNCSHYPEFVATSEDPKVLKVMFDLEQMTGREIIWLRGYGWEQMMALKRAVPNMAKRFCTTIMKIIPIFEFLFMQNALPCKMRVGFRYDEMERKEKFSTLMKYATHCEFQPKSARWIHRWKEIEWRVGEFNLIEDKINHFHVQEFWRDKQIDFPLDSNCQNCFWKDPQQLRKNFDTNPAIMWWAAIQEELMGYTFKEEMSFLNIQKIGVQLDFFFGTGAGCSSGFCTS